MSDQDLKHRIAAARERFAAQTAGLEPRVLEMKLRGMAGKAIGTEPGQVDPVEHALAKHSLELITHRNAANQAQAEHAELSRRPPPHMKRADYVAALDRLEQAHARAVARVAALSEHGFESELQAAARHYARGDELAAQASRIRDAAVAKAEALRSATENEAADLAALSVASRR